MTGTTHKSFMNYTTKPLHHKQIVTLYILCFCLWTAAQNWITAEDGRGASYISVLEVDNDALYAGTWGNGVYRSRDNGLNWKPVNNGLTNKYVYAILVEPEALFAGTEGGGVMRYDKKKLIWNTANEGIEDYVVFSLADFRGALFASTWMNGVHRSMDEGGSWRRADSGLDQSTVYALYASDRYIYAGTARNGVYRSDDTAATWKQLGLSNKSILCAVAFGGKVWFGTWESGIYSYNESTGEWEHISFVVGEPVKAFTFQVPEGVAYCAKRTIGVFKSGDFGQSCSYAGLAGYDVFTLAACGERVVAGTWGSGIFVQTGKDTTWTNTARSLDDTIVIQNNGGDGSAAGMQPSHRKREVLYAQEYQMVSEEKRILSEGSFTGSAACVPGKLIVCYTVRQSGKISLKLYTSRGVLKLQRVDEARAFHHHKVFVTKETLAPGLYFVRLASRVDEKILPVVLLPQTY